MDQNNDIRAALGALRISVNEIREKVAGLEKVAEFGHWIDEQISAFPDRAEDMIKRLEADPMLGSFVAPILGPQVRALAEDIRARRHQDDTE